MNRTGQAHEVREEQRTEFVEKLRANAERAEGVFGTKDWFYQILVLLIAKEISHVHKDTDTEHFSDIPDHIVKQVTDFYWEDIRTPVKKFKKSDEEAVIIYIRLLEAIAPTLEEINRSKVMQQEKENPKQMLGAENRMDQVPYDQHK